MSNQYAQRDHRALGEHYLRHVSAMTGEGLHAKSDIAAELAWRDAEIERLRSVLQRLACLGNGDRPGNSEGNVIAIEALAATEPETTAVPPTEAP